MKSIFTVLAVVLLTVFVLPVMAQKALPIVKAPVTYAGPNLKIMPAFYNNTYGLSFEKPISDRFSLELSAAYKFPTSKPTEESEPKNNIYKSGYLVNLTGKYFLGTAPNGWYFSATVGASNILYKNGTAAPYAFLLNGKKSQDISGAYNTPNPNSLRYNVGTGYQWSMISRKLIANIGFGIGGYSDSDGTKLHLMFTPSVGYIF